MRAIVTLQECSHTMALPRSHERMEVRSSASHTPAGIFKGFDASGIAQGMRDARLSPYKAFRSRQ